MNHDSLVRAISALFPGLTTVPPTGTVPSDQTSFWIPALPRNLGRVVRVKKKDARMKKVASARTQGSEEQSSLDARFDGSLVTLRALISTEIELVRELAEARGISVPANLEAEHGEPVSEAEIQFGEVHQERLLLKPGPQPELAGGRFEAATAHDWTDEELSATVGAYREMISFASSGRVFVKAAYYRQLSERFGRVPGAFERRMQNISYLLVVRGIDHLPGLKPQRNIGSNVEPRLAAFVEPLFRELEHVSEYANELAEPLKVVEGAKKQVTVNAYERDSTAKPRCISKWGTACVVCSFDFGAAYGELGQGFIHVHHLRPIHTIGESYELDPENDLRPVCPNCHSMLHRRRTALSIEELADQLRWRFVAPPPAMKPHGDDSAL